MNIRNLPDLLGGLWLISGRVRFAGVEAQNAVVAGDKVYVLTVSGSLVCLASGDGAELWRQSLEVPDDDAYASPTLAGRRLYVAAGGKLYCLGERGGGLHASSSLFRN